MKRSIVLLALCAALALAVFLVLHSSREVPQTAVEKSSPTKNIIEIDEEQVETAPVEKTSPSKQWTFNGVTWSGELCSEPLTLQTPVDMSKVTSALWPGQFRGEDYKAHGAFRFDSSQAEEISVRAPIDSDLVQAGRYLEEGQVQYLLFFTTPCGYFYRFDHPSVLSPKLAEALKELPPAQENDSRTYFITPLKLKKGELISTSVGLSTNVFVDFGLYDAKKPNGLSIWSGATDQFAVHGVCFFDYLPPQDAQKLRSLPTGLEGKTSDYCK